MLRLSATLRSPPPVTRSWSLFTPRTVARQQRRCRIGVGVGTADQAKEEGLTGA
jgi:hypothetical protein